MTALCPKLSLLTSVTTSHVTGLLVGILFFRFAAFGLGGNSLNLYHVAVRVGVYELTLNHMSDENKLTLCNKVLGDINEALILYAPVSAFDSQSY